MIDQSLLYIKNELEKRITERLDGVGLLFRLFSRVKEKKSMDEKIKRKNISASHLMEDLIGFRLVAYFQEDIDLMEKICDMVFGEGEPSKDLFDHETFRAKRCNVVYSIPQDLKNDFDVLKKNCSDYEFVAAKFEIQFRTVLSEGWLEVDHLMRYKCKDEWDELAVESRMMNGLFATLETCDMTMSNLFNKLAYTHYKKGEWMAMMRNHLMLDFGQCEMNKDICAYFSTKIKEEGNNIAKKMFKIKRDDVIQKYIDLDVYFPPKLVDNWVYFINYFFVQDPEITKMTPALLLKKFENAEKNALRKDL